MQTLKTLEAIDNIISMASAAKASLSNKDLQKCAVRLAQVGLHLAAAVKEHALIPHPVADTPAPSHSSILAPQPVPPSAS